MNKRGFTLIEAVMVMVIAGVLIAVVIISGNSSVNTLRLEAARLKLKGDLGYAQLLAVTQQVVHGIIFNPSTETYSIYRQTTSNIVNDPLNGRPFTVNYTTDSRFQGVVMTSTSFGSPTTDRVEFNSFGAPSDGANTLTADGNVVLNHQSQIATIIVTKNTGKAS